MSSSSLYDPEEDDDASTSNSDIDIDPNQHHAPPGPEQHPSFRIRKRKRGTRDQAIEQLYQSLPRQSVEAYAALFAENQTASDDAPPAPAAVPATGESEAWHSTQHGVVTWTSREKEILHQILERRGVNGVAEIARAVGTKSELEVQEYLRLLHRGVERQHLHDRHSRTVILGEVPAATEISARCCRALDPYATLLSLADKQAEDVAGQRRHHHLWIVDHQTAEKVEAQLDTLPDGVAAGGDLPPSSVYTSARLLNMKMWVRLSERCFMNFGGDRLDDNWVNVAYAEETPSLTADALGEFYALAVSLTRRLVHSALFFAMARLRNMRETGNPKAQVVRTRDVHAALNVLEMRRDRADYWVGLARRCSLEVADLRHRVGWEPVPLSYDEVEGILSGEIPFDTEAVAGTRSASRQRRPSQTDDENDGEDTGERHSEDESEPGSEAASVLSSPIVSSDEEELPADLEEEHAEQVDEQASRREERRLWEMMGRPVPASVAVEIKDEDELESKLQRPTGERKTKEDLVSWRDRTLYRSEWEEYGHEVFDLYEEMSQDRRKKRRVAAPETATTDPIEDFNPSPQDPNKADPASREENDGTDAPDDGMDIDPPEPERSHAHPGCEDEPHHSSASAASAVDSEESNHPPLQPKQLSRVRKTGNDNEELSSSSQDDLLPPNRANMVVRRQKRRPTGS